MSDQKRVDMENLLGYRISMALKGAETLIHDLVSNGGKPDDLFHNKRDLLGFQIGWLKPINHKKICELAGINPEKCEIVLMHAHSLTECHMHQKGGSTFLVLGETHGCKNPNGGILTATAEKGKTKYSLSDNKSFTGQLIKVPAGQIHAFYGNEQGGLSALGFVYPKINIGENDFDVVEYQFIGNLNEVQILN